MMINDDDVDSIQIQTKLFTDRTATQLAEWPGDVQGARGSGALNKRCDLKITVNITVKITV